MKPQSKRDKRAQILYDELQYWGLISYESDMRAVKAIANELPQRMGHFKIKKDARRFVRC